LNALIDVLCCNKCDTIIAGYSQQPKRVMFEHLKKTKHNSFSIRHGRVFVSEHSKINWVEIDSIALQWSSQITTHPANYESLLLADWISQEKALQTFSRSNLLILQDLDTVLNAPRSF